MMLMSRTGLIALAASLPLLAPGSGHAGSLVTLYSFSGGADGAMPYSNVFLRNGMLYGTTSMGGASGQGTVFAVDPASHGETVLYSLAGGVSGGEPDTALTYRAGWLWGTAATGGVNKAGTVFKVELGTGKPPRVFSLPGGVGGAQPASSLLGMGSALYAVTNAGGASGVGTVVKINPASGAATVVHSFDKLDGSFPLGNLLAYKTMLLGTTSYAGGAGYGTVFQVDPASGQSTTLYSFKGGKDGAFPQTGLVASGGYLYGTTPLYGGAGYGTLFRIDPTTGTETVLHSFAATEGAANGTLAMKGSTIYGTTSGGRNGSGTIFSYDTKSGTETTAYSFAGNGDGFGPNGLIYSNGMFYGTTQYTTSAPNQGLSGTVFEYTP